MTEAMRLAVTELVGTIEPTAFGLHPAGTFAVADAPNGRERIQFFGWGGARLGGFTLPGRATPRIRIGALSLSGVGSLAFTGRSIELVTGVKAKESEDMRRAWNAEQAARR